MTDEALARTDAYQWPCRPGAEKSRQIEVIRASLGLRKTGVISYLLTLGIEAHETQKSERQHLNSLRAQGLTLSSILPYIGGRPGRRG